jgi:peptidoglycan/LPS O-acetylase OafA/YrhL
MNGRIWGLDLIRTVSILLVLVGHTIIAKIHGNVLGGIGVEIFFVLSGFLIGQILIKDFKKELTPRSVFHFWIRRWFRTLPLYFLFITVKFVFFDHSLGSGIIVYYLFLQNNVIGIDFFPVSWSLVIEEWFYLLIPIGLLIISFGKLNMKRFLFFLIGFIIFENLFRLGWILYTDRPFSGIIANFPFRLDSLIVGVLLAYFKMEYQGLYFILKKGWFFFLGLILFLLLLYFFGTANLNGNKNEFIWTRTFWFFLVSFFIAMMIPFVEAVKRPHPIIATIVERISLYTYSIYLLHFSIIGWMVHAEKYTSAWLFQTLSAYMVIFISCAMIYHFFEKPVMDLRDKIKIWKK